MMILNVMIMKLILNNNNHNNDDRHDIHDKIITIITILTKSSNKFVRKMII